MRRCLLPLLSVCLALTTALAAGFGELPYKPRAATARVRDYKVAGDLSNVSNRRQLPTLTAEQRARLVANGFVARPTAEEQMFYLYEDNAYRGIPQFVTTDSVLHTYHVFYDFVLRHLETDKLLPALAELSTQLLGDGLAAWRREPVDSPIKAALGRAVAYLAVPPMLLNQKVALPPELRPLVMADMALIEAHAKRAKCALGPEIDFTQFIPRGHYTRSDELKRYFLAMMWYGLVPMDLAADGPLTEAMLVAELLDGSKRASQLWAEVYEPTAFYVGVSDDIGARDLAPLIKRVYGEGGLARLADKNRQAAFLKLVDLELKAPGIAQATLVDGEEKVQGRQFRLMGQRYLPDSRMFQELCYPNVGTQAQPRLFPKGLDAFAVMGSARAAELLDGLYAQGKYEKYGEQRAKLTKEFAALSTSDWAQSLYFGWFWALQPLLKPAPAGYPGFMRNAAWGDKQLIAALGSWTELRHDTILYGKQSVAEAGGDEPEPPAGYVEPSIEVYERLGWLLRLTQDGLRRRGIVAKESDLDWSLETFAQLCDNLADISVKELTGTPLTVQELSDIKWIGGALEGIMLSAARLQPDAQVNRWWSIQNKTDRHMALVADVHTSFDQVLQEAVGTPAELWVVAPFKDRLVAFRGASFQYYEFVHPAGDRLTDEAWQAMVAAGKAPKAPEWTASYLLPPGIARPQVTSAPGPG